MNQNVSGREREPIAWFCRTPTTFVGLRRICRTPTTFVGLRPLLSDSDHFCRTPTTFVGLRRICRTPTKFVGVRQICRTPENLSDSDQIRRTDHTVNPADAISQKRASHRPKERGNESPRAQRSQISQIHLVAPPQGAGKRIIKSPEPLKLAILVPLHPGSGEASPQEPRAPQISVSATLLL